MPHAQKLQKIFSVAEGDHFQKPSCPVEREHCPYSLNGPGKKTQPIDAACASRGLEFHDDGVMVRSVMARAAANASDTRVILEIAKRVIQLCILPL